MKQSKTLASGFPVMLDEERAKYVAREVKYEETIAELRQQLAAANAEIERLKTVPMKYRRMAFNAQLQDENRELEKQLAASQAREQPLRDELFAVLVQDMPDFKARLKVYAIPADTTAIEALIAKAGEVMREWCRKVAFDMAYADSLAVDVSQTIRAIPAVTIDDLKGGA